MVPRYALGGPHSGPVQCMRYLIMAGCANELGQFTESGMWKGLTGAPGD